MKTTSLRLSAAVAATALISACTDPGSLGLDGPNAKTNQGVLLGTAVGAGLGNLIGGDTGATAIGAVVGGVAGGVIGNRLDKQAAELRQQVGNDNISVVNTGDRLVVSLPQDITFDTDSAVVRSSLRPELSAVANNLVQYPNQRVQVIGHTDNTGEAGYNLTLSQRRASAVADILAVGGVGYNRMQTLGQGENIPVASNLTPEGRQQNRRVEIVIIPNDIAS